MNRHPGLPMYTTLFQALQFAIYARLGKGRLVSDDERNEEFRLIASCGSPCLNRQFEHDGPTEREEVGRGR